MPDYAVCDDIDVVEGSRILVTIESIEIGVFRVGGRLYAYRNRCPHDGGPVCAGTVTGNLAQGPETDWKPRWEQDGEILYCPWHGSDFNLLTGEAISRRPLRLSSYPVRSERGKVTVTL